MEIDGSTAIARREVPGGWEIFEVPLPAVFTVKEGINLPRYPSLPGKLKAKKKEIDQSQPAYDGGGLEMVRFRVPQEQASQVEILGEGVEAAPQIVALLDEMGLLQ